MTKLPKDLTDKIQKVKNEFPDNKKGKEIAKIIKEHYKISHYFNIYEFVNELGLELYSGDFGKNENEIWGSFDSKERKIYISSHLNTLRAKRFTIAHELGHYFIEWDANNNGDIYYRNKLNPKEVVFNDFAANLLIPVSDEVFKDMLKEKTNYKLAHEFDIPFDTIGILAEKLLKDENV